MPYFAFLYRATRELDEQQLARRGQVVRAWTVSQLEAGRVVTVSVFDQEGCNLAPGSDDAAGTRASLAGCTIVRAQDLQQAMELARAFPGRQFGTAVEICPVKTFVAPAKQHPADDASSSRS